MNVSLPPSSLTLAALPGLSRRVFVVSTLKRKEGIRVITEAVSVILGV